ncbi:MAG: DUF4980 domain-containing protein, partial [Bacteroidota bacterium]
MKNNQPGNFLRFVFISFFLFTTSLLHAQVDMKITKHYLNIPVGTHARMKLVQLQVNGKMKREFPVQLAEDSISYWIFIDVSEFKNQKITITAPAKEPWLKRIYQDDVI